MWGARLAAPFKEFGFAAGWLYLVDRAMRALAPRLLGLAVYEIVAQPVPLGATLPEHRARKVHFRLLPRDAPELGLMPPPGAVLQQRFERGAVCLGVYRDDAFIGYLWFAFGGYDEDEARCRYELTDREHSAFDFDVYVMPEHRLGFAFAALWHAGNEFLRSRGIRWTYSRIARFNNASRRAHAQLGAVRIGRVLFLRVAALQLMLSTLRPFVSLAWGAGCPTLRLKYDDRSMPDQGSPARRRP